MKMSSEDILMTHELRPATDGEIQYEKVKKSPIWKKEKKEIYKFDEPCPWCGNEVKEEDTVLVDTNWEDGFVYWIHSDCAMERAKNELNVTDKDKGGMFDDKS